MDIKEGRTERIGEFLLRIEALTEPQQDEILERQQTNPDKKFGEIAIELGYINDDAIDRYLESRGRSST